MRRSCAPIFALSLFAVAAGCNEHSLKSVEYSWHQNCGQSHSVTVERPQIMLALDRSGSMTAPAERWDHDNDPTTPDRTRWSSLHAVTTDLLERTDGRMHFGAVLFPSDQAHDADSAGPCLTSASADVRVSADGAARILAEIPDADAKTAGGTPTRAGLLNAVEHLDELEDTSGRAIVLVTDGAANCVDETYEEGEYDEGTMEVVEQALLDGIPTYIVGIGITPQHPVAGRDLVEDMNALARAGGAAKAGEQAFYNVFDQAALDDALTDIADRVLCTVAVDPPHEIDAELVVTVAGVAVPMFASCDSSEGWSYTDATRSEIRLCGSACDTFVEHGSVTAKYDCSPEL